MTVNMTDVQTESKNKHLTNWNWTPQNRDETNAFC